MPSLWTVSISAASTATFVATWLLLPTPHAGVAPPPPALQAGAAAPVQPKPVTAPAGGAALPVRLASRAALPAHPVPRRAKPAADTVYYPGCNAVRAAGRAPLYRGQPGYRVEMDGDLDGIACEPHRNRW